MAAHGRTPATRNLVELCDQARAVVPDLDLASPLDHLSEFVGGERYDTPDLSLGTEDLCDRMARDLVHLFVLIRDHSSFDPWTVQTSGFRY